MQEAAMNEFLSVNLVPSLQTATATRICITFYLRDNLIELLGKQPNLTEIHPKVWFEQKKIVEGLISLLKLPECMKKKVSSFYDDIGDELLNWIKSNDWIQYRPDYGKQDGTFPLALYDYLKNCLIWSARGTILHERTARKILQSDFITKEEEFHLSCSYCFLDILSYSFVPELSRYRSIEEYREEPCPFVYYWVSRFFLDQRSTVGYHLGLSNEENIDAFMLTKVKNDVAKKYLFDRLDLIEKERVFRIAFARSDFRMKIYLLSQISYGTREAMFTNPISFLYGMINILWQDYILFYFNVYGQFITSSQCLRIIQQLLLSDNTHTNILRVSSNDDEEDIIDYGWKKLVANEMWNCISENSRKNAITQGLVRLTSRYGIYNTSLKGKSLLSRVLSVLLHFSDSDPLVGELLTRAEDETVKLAVSNNVPNHIRYFSIDDQSYERVVYYPRKNSFFSNRTIDSANLNLNKRLYLVHELLSLKAVYDINPLKNDRIQNDIVDLFVEYVRCGEVANIDEILNHYFPVTSEKISYKSSLLVTMFNKLLTKAVNESYYYFRTAQNIAPIAGNGGIAIRDARLVLLADAERIAVRGRDVRRNRGQMMLHRPRDRLYNLFMPGLVRPAEYINDLGIHLMLPADPLADNIYPMPHFINAPRLVNNLTSPVIYNSDNSDIIFTAVDAFLNCFFISAEQINDFKTDTVYNECVPIIETLLSENKALKLKKVLRWFLSYDQEKIITFKNTSRRHDLTSIL